MTLELVLMTPDETTKDHDTLAYDYSPEVSQISWHSISLPPQGHLPVLLYSLVVYSSIDSSQVVGNSPEVSNFNRLFLKLHRFDCN